MKPTPGQLLAAELERQSIGKSEFARRARRTYQTVHNWTRDRGFLPTQRAEAARVLGLAPDCFDAPDLSEQRERYRQSVLAAFRETELGATLSKEEWRCIESLSFPYDLNPTITKYEGIVLVLRGVIDPAQVRPSNAAPPGTQQEAVADSDVAETPTRGARRPKRRRR